MSDKRIMVITPHTPSLLWFRMDMMLDFKSRGYDVVAVGDETPEKWEKEFAEYHIKYRQIPIARHGMNPLQDLITIRAIRKLYDQEHPQKVFLYEAKAIIYGSIAGNKKMEIYSLLAGIGSSFRVDSRKQKILRRVLRMEYRLALKKDTAVLFHNHDDMEQFILWRVVERRKCHVVHGSGVNIEKFAFEENVMQPATFLMVGRLVRFKGVMEYLEACKIIKTKYPDVKCMLVGNFDTNPDSVCEKDIEKYLEYVEWYGEQKDVRPYLKQCTTFVLPSYFEGHSKALLEAMSVGRPVITTDSPGGRESVNDGVDGFLIPIKDVQSLVEKMEYFIKNPQEQARMGKNARKTVEECYAVGKVNAEIGRIMKLEESFNQK